MHTRPLIFLHSDASWMLIVYHDILMRSIMIFVFTYGLLLLLPNDSYFDSATIMCMRYCVLFLWANNKIFLSPGRGRVTRWTRSSRSTLVNNWYKCLENQFNYGTRALADASYYEKLYIELMLILICHMT
ncbi:hypothetical protein AMTRI_Chr05g71570 [Amborella trichopoda]